MRRVVTASLLICALAAAPSVAIAQSDALIEAVKQSRALYQQGRYEDAEVLSLKALKLGEKELEMPTTRSTEP